MQEIIQSKMIYASNPEDIRPGLEMWLKDIPVAVWALPKQQNRATKSVLVLPKDTTLKNVVEHITSPAIADHHWPLRLLLKKVRPMKEATRESEL